MKGLVHSIETFSTSDGPGIRTVVFLQGCLLRCIYCQNPDTWAIKSEFAREYTVQELCRIITRNKPYFQSSGGGITFSGGEPMLQPDFVTAVFKICRQNNIHTAFESSLFCRSQYIEKVLPYTDLVLADIKASGQAGRLNLTAVNPANRANINNLHIINDANIPIWLRYVVLPGLTDRHFAIDSLISLARDFPHVIKVELLPYHGLGRHKWTYLGFDYSLDELPTPSRSQLEEIAGKIRRGCGKEVHIR